MTSPWISVLVIVIELTSFALFVSSLHHDSSTFMVTSVGIGTRFRSMSSMSISAETGSTTAFAYSDVVNESDRRGNDLASTVFLAEAAMLCNASPDAIIKKLACKRRINMKAITRDVSSTQTRYNVVDFEEVEDDGSIRLRRVIAVRGSTSIKNLQDSTDSLFDYDELLQMNVHRGFRRVMYSILDDFPEFVLNKHVAVDKDSKEEETREINYSLCGHSLGYI